MRSREQRKGKPRWESNWIVLPCDSGYIKKEIKVEWLGYEEAVNCHLLRGDIR